MNEREKGVNREKVANMMGTYYVSDKRHSVRTIDEETETQRC